MVKVTGFGSMEDLIDATVPKSIKRKELMDMGKYTAGFTESGFLSMFKYELHSYMMYRLQIHSRLPGSTHVGLCMFAWKIQSFCNIQHTRPDSLVTVAWAAMSVCMQGIKSSRPSVLVYQFLHLHILLEADVSLADAQ